MPRRVRVGYPGAIYRVMIRANGKGNIFETVVDREQRQESAEAKAEGIIREKVERLGWSEGQLSQRPKSGPAKLAMSARLRRETTLSLPRGLQPGCTRGPGRAAPQARKPLTTVASLVPSHEEAVERYG